MCIFWSGHQVILLLMYDDMILCVVFRKLKVKDQTLPNPQDPKMLRSSVSLNCSNCNKPSFRGRVILTSHVHALGNRSSLQNWIDGFLEIHWVESWKLLTQIQVCRPTWQDPSLYYYRGGEWTQCHDTETVHMHIATHACTHTHIHSYASHTCTWSSHWYTPPSWAWQLLLYVHLNLV